MKDCYLPFQVKSVTTFAMKTVTVFVSFLWNSEENSESEVAHDWNIKALGVTVN